MDRRRFFAVAAGMSAGAVVGCGGNGGGGGGDNPEGGPPGEFADNVPENGETIKLVSSMPRTGSAKGQTDTILNGIKMAIDEFGGKVAGFKIGYEDWDDATPGKGSWTAELESANARKAIADEDVVAYIGPYNSGAAKISMPLLNDAGLLQVSAAVTWTGLTKAVDGGDPQEPDIYRPTGKVTFGRVCPSDDTQGPLAADFARKELKAKKVYILDDKELYGQGVSGLFERRCRQLGLEVMAHESINVTSNDFSALMTKIKGANPDLVYFGGTTQSKGGQVAKDMRRVGIGCPLMVPDGCYELSFIESAGEASLKNCYVTMGGIDPQVLREKGGPGAKFLDKYKAKFGNDPEAYAVYGYEAALVVLMAIRDVVKKKDRAAILKATLGTKKFNQGALGEWGFDPNGDTTLQQLTISVVEGGKFKPVKTIDKV